MVYDSSPSVITTDAKCQKLRGLFATVVVTTKQRLLRNADRARDETYFLSFLRVRVICFSHVVLCFFGFHPNFVPLRALSFFTFFSWRCALPSGIFHLLPSHGDLHHGVHVDAFHTVRNNFGFQRLHASSSLPLIAFPAVSLITTCTPWLFLGDSGLISSV